MSAWLDALLGRISDAGTTLGLGYGINFNSGVRARLNPSTRFVDIDLRDEAVTPTQIAIGTTGFSVALVKRVAFAAGIGGAADDVAIMLDAPFNYRILDVVIPVLTADSGDTLQLRSATAGGGSALSSVLSGGATGTVRNNDTQTRIVVEGGNVYLRRSTNLIAGEVIIYAERT